MVYVISGYTLNMELLRFIGRADVGHGNKKCITNHCVSMTMCFFVLGFFFF